MNSNDSRFGHPEFQTPSAATRLPNLNPQSVSPTAQPGGFWIRFLASFIDGIIVGVATIPVSIVMSILNVWVMRTSGGLGMTILSSVASYAVNMVIVYFYYGWFYSQKGATPGKMIFGLKVLDAETGVHLTYWRAFFRETLGKFLSGITLLIGFIMAGFRQDKRSLHDFIFNTQVLRFKQ